jgi:hypothetical protein
LIVPPPLAAVFGSAANAAFTPIVGDPLITTLPPAAEATLDGVSQLIDGE